MISRKMLKKRQNEVKRNIFLFDEVKNIAGQVLTYNSKNFHWLKKLDLKRTMNGLEKPFRKKTDPKNQSKNQSEIAACEQKTTSKKANFCSNTVFSLYFKFRAKKFHAAKPLAFSLHFLCRRDQIHHLKNHENVWTDRFFAPNHSLFRSISCFGVTKITPPIWLQKSWKCVNRS